LDGRQVLEVSIINAGELKVGRGDSWSSSRSGAARLPLSGCRGVWFSLEAGSLQPFGDKWKTFKGFLDSLK
jgi:hypothetical protein